MLLAFEVLVRLLRLLEVEDLVHHRVDLAGAEQAVHALKPKRTTSRFDYDIYER